MQTLPDKIYCKDIIYLKVKDQLEIARKAGRQDRDIFVEGRGAETLDACLNAIRGAGTLGLPGGLRAFGDSRVAIMEKMRALRARGIRVYDLQTGEDDTGELLAEAVAKIAGARSLRLNPRQPVRLGRRGGMVKGIRAQEKRDAILQEAIVKRLCAHPKLNWKDCAQILGPNWSESTLRRLYDVN